jgi:hypothetical protein
MDCHRIQTQLPDICTTQQFLTRLPEDDLYQDVVFNSATCDVGFVKGLHLECSAMGLDLGSSTDLLRLIDVTFAMSQCAGRRGVHY